MVNAARGSQHDARRRVVGLDVGDKVVARDLRDVLFRPQDRVAKLRFL